MYFNPIDAGTRLRELREKAGYSQEQFSEKLNISRNYLAKVETGVRQPSIDLWIEIAVLTGTTLDYLILGRNNAVDQVKQQLQDTIAALTKLQTVL